MVVFTIFTVKIPLGGTKVMGKQHIDKTVISLYDIILHTRH